MVNEERLIRSFLQLVQIDSLSGKEGKIARFIKEELQTIGLEVMEDQAGKAIGGETGNIIGKLSSLNGGTSILLNAHMDTIGLGEKVKPGVREGTIYSEGSSILGADDKSGIAAILEGLKVVKERDITIGKVEVIFTVAEENGLNGAKNLDYESIESKMGFVLDGDGAVGEVINQAPAQEWIKATIIGKSAHAGVCPEEGINAIQVASVAISNMRLGRIDTETTANIGIIQGGVATNVVPERVLVEGEARSRKESKLKAQIDLMQKAFQKAAEKFNAKTELNIERAYSSFKVNKSELPIRIAIQSAKRLGLHPTIKPGGGGSDANIFNQHGISSILISTGAEKVHTPYEYISIANLVKTAEYVISLIQTSKEIV